MRNQPQSFEDREEDLGDMVESEMRRMVVPAEPVALARIPDYIQHREDVDQVGKLTAEVLAMSYEASAKQIEAMGAGLMDGLRQCEADTLNMVRECERVKVETDEAVASCAAAAEVYRAQAKELFERIQDRAIKADKVRKTCAIMIEEVK